MAVSKRTRYEVLRRDNFTCRYCRSTENPLTVDHVVPVTLGGTDDPSNLVAACKDCNYGKASSSPDQALVDQVSDDAVRWARALTTVVRARARQQKKRDAYTAAFHAEWTAHTYDHQQVLLPINWQSSIERFYDLGVPIDELLRCIKVTCGNERIHGDDAFRYFCGCAWRVVTEIQQAAREVVADGS